MEEQLELKIVVENDREIPLQHCNFHDWDFFWSEEKMMLTKDLDMVAEKMKIPHLPDMCFGYNRIYLVNSSYDFVYEINPLEMLNLTSFEERTSRLIDIGKLNTDGGTKDYLNFIYYIPLDTKVQYYDKWKDLKVDRDDIQTMNPTSDWTFTSSYMGTVGKLSESPLKKFYKNIDGTFNVTVQQTDQSLPISRLGQDNPILKYMEVNLFDDELCDNGLSEGKFRLRIMEDCFFGLLRSYLRVDNVLVRIIDTRIFHSFGESYIFRDFQVKENSCDALNKKGFTFTSEWSLSQGQSDLVSRYMETIFSTRDLILLT